MFVINKQHIDVFRQLEKAFGNCSSVRKSHVLTPRELIPVIDVNTVK